MSTCVYAAFLGPSSTIRGVCRNLKDIISDDCVIVNTAKGLEKGSQKRMSVVIEEEIGRNIKQLRELKCRFSDSKICTLESLQLCSFHKQT